jgi:hypothetical protein
MQISFVVFSFDHRSFQTYRNVIIGPRKKIYRSPSETFFVPGVITHCAFRRRAAGNLMMREA